jgi:hypothetical protein
MLKKKKSTEGGRKRERGTGIEGAKKGRREGEEEREKGWKEK